MRKYLSSSLNNIVSFDSETSWAAKSLKEAIELSKYNARFQQKQMQEKEEKLLRLYENQQQRTFERVGRGSAGSNSSVGSIGGGKVRQMFDERRQKAGVDKSYPLEPLKSKNGPRGPSLERKNPITTSRTIVKSTVQKSVSHVRNGKPLVSKREIVHRVYNNNNGDQTYEEHKIQDDNVDLLISRENRENSHKDLIDMMNDHNIHDALDNEEMPDIGFDEVDEPRATEKLSNVGLSMLNDNLSDNKLVESKTVGKPNGVLTAATKPAAKKPVRSSTSSKVSSPAPSSRKSTPTSPSGSASKTMQSAKSKTSTPSSARAPSSSRPSAKQQTKSPVVRDDLTECRHCGRRFATDRLATHEDICSKTGKKRRRTYDATKHRVQGTELESYVIKGKKSGASARSSSKQVSKKDWRKTHEEFVAAIRAAKQAQAHVAKGGKLSDLPPPPPSSNPDYVQCPHCSRRFNEAAANRHIPKCATYQYNKPKPGASSVQKGKR